MALNRAEKTAASGPQLSRTVFGGVFDYDGAGYYPGLELLNFVYCTAEQPVLPCEKEISVSRQAHDFARKLVWDDNFHSHPKRKEVLFDDSTELAVRHLLECLQLRIPSSRSRPAWERAHFFPYTKSLVHWDARRRKGTRPDKHLVGIERRYLRGGGAFAFHALRMDTDGERLARGRSGFDQLFPEGDASPLEKLAAVLAQHGQRDEEPRVDDIEPDSRCPEDGLEDLFRDGTVRILEHTDLSVVARLRAIMNWTAFWLVLVQHSRAADYLRAERRVIIADCAAVHPQLRRASQRCLKDLQTLILDAVEKARVDTYGENSELNKKQRDRIKGFFWATAATINLLNAWGGRRHFTLGIDILETLVLASTGRSNELPFDQFIDTWLFDKYRVVVGRQAAEKAELLSSFDATIFEDNENQLASQMAAAGLLNEYSDTTRMVGTGGLK